jgi:hypothetical protein
MTTIAPATDRRPPRRARAVLAALLALLSLASVVELHRDHALVEPAPVEAAGAAAAGCHPDLATHLEPPNAPRSRHCPACLLRLATRGAEVHAETPFAPLLAPRESVPEQGFVARFAPAASRLSRGPPAA